jgi:carboxymethylenebutenolidase
VPAEQTSLGRFVCPERSESSEPLPGVVFIHDVWGPSPHSEAFSDRLSAAGFGVLAIDFYRDLEAREIEDPAAFIRGLSDPDVLEDVARGVAFLSERPETRGAPVGVTGVCMGGMYTLLAACRVLGLSAAAAFYGMLSFEHGMLADPDGLDRIRKPVSPLDAVRDLECPLLAFFGTTDTFIPMADVQELERRLTESSHDAEVVCYPDAGHAFMNETRPEAHRPEAAQDAWARLIAFLSSRLKPTSPV